MKIIFVDFKVKLRKTIFLKRKFEMRVYIRVIIIMIMIMITIMVLAGIVKGATSKNLVC